jgi:hypothetical protein
MVGKLHCHLITATLTKLPHHTGSDPSSHADQLTSKLYWQMGLPDKASLQFNVAVTSDTHKVSQLKTTWHNKTSKESAIKTVPMKHLPEHIVRHLH